MSGPHIPNFKFPNYGGTTVFFERSARCSFFDYGNPTTHTQRDPARTFAASTCIFNKNTRKIKIDEDGRGDGSGVWRRGGAWLRGCAHVQQARLRAWHVSLSRTRRAAELTPEGAAERGVGGSGGQRGGGAQHCALGRRQPRGAEPQGPRGPCFGAARGPAYRPAVPPRGDGVGWLGACGNRNPARQRAIDPSIRHGTH
jgi:hypothetical protein